MYQESEMVGIQVLYVEEGLFDARVTYTLNFADGTRLLRRARSKKLPRLTAAQTVAAAQPMGRARSGLLRLNVRSLFAVTLADGTMHLIQVWADTQEEEDLLRLGAAAAAQPPAAAPADTAAPAASAASTPAAPAPAARTAPAMRRGKAQTGSAESYLLKPNELPQGVYQIGQDIPAGTYDLFVTYGEGKVDLRQYVDGKAIDGTWEFYHVGRKEKYQHPELVHLSCREGYTLKIEGNVVLKIVPSRPVQIRL